MRRFGRARVAAAAVAATAAFAAAVLAGSQPPPPAADLDRVVTGLQARYDSTSSFKATFRQQIESRAWGQKLDSWGMVYFRRPGRMRWEFLGPEKQTVVADGKTLWMYQEAQRQVVKVELASAFRTTTPMSFLVGLGNLREDFEAELAPESTEGQVGLRLRPRAERAEVGALELELARDTYDILGAVVTDATGGTTRWRFADLERNPTLADELFEFTVPPGVDVVVPPS